jgi:hypothetical protein
MVRVTGLWIYQTLGDRPDPDIIAARAKRHGLQWLSAEALVSGQVSGEDWLRGMRRATRAQGLRLAVHGYVGRPHPAPAADATAISDAIAVAEPDFAIVNAEIEYEQAAGPVSRQFVDAYRQLRPHIRTYFSSFGRPSFHASLGWQAWADGGFRGMPQAYENLNGQALKPRQCVEDYARFFPRDTMRPTLGCFAEHGQPRLPLARLKASVHEVPGLSFNVYRHGTVTDLELAALSTLE